MGSSPKHLSDKRNYIPYSHRYNQNSRNKLASEEIAMMKADATCHFSQRFTHLSYGHNNYGTLRPGVLSHKSSKEVKTAFSLSFGKASGSINSFSTTVICLTVSVFSGTVEDSLGFVNSNSRGVIGPYIQAVAFAANTGR